MDAAAALGPRVDVAPHHPFGGRREPCQVDRVLATAPLISHAHRIGGGVL